jgi:hypothetical protein
MPVMPLLPMMPCVCNFGIWAMPLLPMKQFWNLNWTLLLNWTKFLNLSNFGIWAMPILNWTLPPYYYAMVLRLLLLLYYLLSTTLLSTIYYSSVYFSTAYRGLNSLAAVICLWRVVLLLLLYYYYLFELFSMAFAMINLFKLLSWGNGIYNDGNPFMLRQWRWWWNGPLLACY